MRTLCAALLIILALGLLGFATGTLDVYFIDVGQGDAILIDYGQYEMLIDGGPDGSCVPFLAQYVDGSLEVLVVTHPHSDHVGGLDPGGIDGVDLLEQDLHVESAALQHGPQNDGTKSRQRIETEDVAVG